MQRASRFEDRSHFVQVLDKYLTELKQGLLFEYDCQSKPRSDKAPYSQGGVFPLTPKGNGLAHSQSTQESLFAAAYVPHTPTAPSNDFPKARVVAVTPRELGSARSTQSGPRAHIHGCDLPGRAHDNVIAVDSLSEASSLSDDLIPPVKNWRTLYLGMSNSKGLFGLRRSSISHQLHPVWSDYLSMLRNDDMNAQKEFKAVWTKVVNRRFGKRNSFEAPADKPWCFVLHPHSTTRVAWRALTLLVLLYDAITVPIITAFDTGDEPAFEVLVWLALIFWVLDIFISFRTGSYIRGVLEMRPEVICRVYARTWLPFDFTLVVFDLISAVTNIISGSQPLGSYGIAARSLRVVRLTRLLRLAEVQFIFRDIISIKSKGAILCSVLIKTTLLYAIFIHFLACLWYLVGRIDDNGWASTCLSDDGGAYCYLQAANWALSCLHGSTSVVYKTPVEWVFATLSVFVGLVLFVFYLGITADAVAHITGADQLVMKQRCTAYSKKHRLTAILSHRLLRSIEASEVLVQPDEQDKQERELLQMLPVALRQEVLEESRKPLLTGSAIMRDLNHISQTMLNYLCSEAIGSYMCLHGELVFAYGDVGSYMRIIETGSLTYVFGQKDFEREESCEKMKQNLRSSMRGSQEDDPPSPAIFTLPSKGSLQNMAGSCDFGSWERIAKHVTEGVERTVSPGRLISEMVLWTPWVHAGDLIVTKDALLLQLSMEAFCEVLRVRFDTCLLVARYAFEYVKRMDNSFDKSDLVSCEPDDYGYDEDEFTRTSSIKDHIAFLSHYKAEAGTEATLMEEALSLLISRETNNNDTASTVFLDSENLTDLSNLKEHVMSSRNLLLLLTPGVLLRPWCLVEAVVARQCGIQIIPIEIQRPGIRFTFPDEEFYRSLRSGAMLTPQAAKLLLDEEITLNILEDVLRFVFMQIALPFSPHKSKGVREAELQDIMKRCLPNRGSKRHQRLHSEFSMSSTASTLKDKG